MVSPRVSVVIATYNRSSVLRYAIECVLAQTVSDWELIVVGDACTDDTEQVVKSFGDERIRFVNLPVNSGEQATPNSEGMRLARGEYVALLNHDDFWTPDHLAAALEVIPGADVATAVIVIMSPSGEAHLTGACPRGVFEPHVFIPASGWLFRRELVARVGPWRKAHTMFLAPSQEWIFRAWKRGMRIRSTGKPTVIAIPSGGRARSYSESHTDEHERMATLLRESQLDHLLAQAAVRMATDIVAATPARLFLRAATILIRRLVFALGGHPHSLRFAFLYGRRGGFLESLHRTRGLPPLPRQEPR